MFDEDLLYICINEGFFFVRVVYCDLIMVLLFIGWSGEEMFLGWFSEM